MKNTVAASLAEYRFERSQLMKEKEIQKNQSTDVAHTTSIRFQTSKIVMETP